MRRNVIIDIMKGICILAVVLRHARAPFSDFFLLFHMAVFFMISGYLFNENSVRGFSLWIRYVLKKVKGLWLPYVAFTWLFLLLHNSFIRCGIYTNRVEFLQLEYLESPQIKQFYTVSQILRKMLDTIFMLTNTEMGGALWFLITLFEVMTFYGFVRFLLCYIPNRKVYYSLRILTSLCMLLLGYYFCVAGRSYYGIERAFSAYCLVDIGNFIKEQALDRKMSSRTCLVLWGTALCALLACKKIGTISFVDNQIENPIFFIFVSVFGWIWTYSLAKLIKNADVKYFIKIVSLFGRYSLWIMALHFLAFKLVNLWVVELYDLPFYAIAGFPVTYSSGIWWVPYTVVGICIPIAAAFCWTKIKKYFMKLSLHNRFRI